MYKTTYDKTKCQTGIIHIGYGAFHRAHQAVYVDDYMEKTGDLQWGIVAVNLRYEGFRDIDNYVVKTPTSSRLVRSHLDFVDWTKNPTIAAHMLSLPSVHLITVTVTESGYAIGSPIFEYLACGFRNRTTPVTVLCCDNIRQNGCVLETRFVAHLYRTHQFALADWVKNNVTFPSCMVDRITPRAQESTRREVERLFPGFGQTVVQTEDYTQWVIENKFASAFPDLTQVGVVVTEDVLPYEETKIRILNGGHTALAYLGVLSGYRTFDQVMHNDAHLKHFKQLQHEDIVPSIDIELPFDVYDYVDTIEKRFSNSTNVDDLERICMDGFTKFHTFIVPSLRVCLQQGRRPFHTYRSIAAWYIYARKFAKGCTKFAYKEPNWLLLEPLLHDNAVDAFVSNEMLWGDVPNTYSTFSKDLKSVLMSHTYEKEIDLLVD